MTGFNIDDIIGDRCQTKVNFSKLIQPNIFQMKTVDVTSETSSLQYHQQYDRFISGHHSSLESSKNTPETKKGSQVLQYELSKAVPNFVPFYQSQITPQNPKFVFAGYQQPFQCAGGNHFQTKIISNDGNSLFKRIFDPFGGPILPFAYTGFRKPKRIRTAFSPRQLLHLEKSFNLNPYVVGQERKELAVKLCLTETQVKVWFQNRRTKCKRGKFDNYEEVCVDQDVFLQQKSFSIH